MVGRGVGTSSCRARGEGEGRGGAGRWGLSRSLLAVDVHVVHGGRALRVEDDSEERGRVRSRRDATREATCGASRRVRGQPKVALAFQPSSSASSCRFLHHCRLCLSLCLTTGRVLSCPRGSLNPTALPLAVSQAPTRALTLPRSVLPAQRHKYMDVDLCCESLPERTSSSPLVPLVEPEHDQTCAPPRCGRWSRPRAGPGCRMRVLAPHKVKGTPAG